MVGIYGITSGTSAVTPRRPEDRASASKDAGALPSAPDETTFSPEARAVAQAGRLNEEATTTDELRAARIEEAKARLEAGTYKLASVVEEVAARITGYIP